MNDKNDGSEMIENMDKAFENLVDPCDFSEEEIKIMNAKNELFKEYVRTAGKEKSEE